MITTNSSERNIINTILDLPNAPLVLQEINSALNDEKKRREEFYNEIDEQMKVEFINGEIIIHSPVVKIHNDVCSNTHRLIDAFVYKNDLGFVGVEKILIQLTRNDYEPDVCFFSKQKSKKFKDNQKFFPAPDLVIAVLSKSTEKRDRTVKYQDYQAHGVLEYWMIDPKKKVVEQYVLKNKKYELIAKSKTGEITSKALLGLQVPVIALFKRKENYDFIQKILVR